MVGLATAEVMEVLTFEVAAPTSTHPANAIVAIRFRMASTAASNLGLNRGYLTNSRAGGVNAG